MKTRASKNTVTDKEEDTAAPVAGLENSNNPPLLFILPENASPDARVLSLPDPVASISTRYYFCPDTGVYEFTKVSVPKKTPRSWLIAPDHANTLDSQPSIVSKGYAVENSELFVATPIDPLFIVLPALIPAPDSHEQLFLSIDDHLDNLAENSKSLKHLIRSDKLRKTFEKRANAVCDNVDLGDEKMYRLSHNRLLADLIQKARRMTTKGLPASIERQFVQEALVMPVSIVQQTSMPESDVSAASSQTVQTESQGVNTPTEASQTPTLSASQSQPSQGSTLTEATSFTSDTTPTTPAEVTDLLRLRTALDLILTSYLPSTLHNPLRTLLSSPQSPIDFMPLDLHLTKIATLKRESQALRSLSDNISRKRSGFADEEADEIRAEKKRKKEEEDAKKKNMSRGVKQLGKVNTNGMAKLSSFFAKAPAKKK